MGNVHDFGGSLGKSREDSAAPFWEEIYRKAFADFGAMLPHPADGWAQRGGVDRTIILKSGKTIRVDEKLREGVWDDFLLERWSDRDRQTPGWIQQDLLCDFIAYAFRPSRTCHLLPFIPLRAAWRKYGREWITAYPQIEAINVRHVTVSVAVPIPVVLSAMNEAMCVSWQKVESVA